MESHNMRVERESAETRKIPWKTLRGADPAVLQEFFENPFYYSRLRFYYHCVSDFLASDADRVQGRKDRPMRKKQKHLEKTDRKRRATERRLQAPRQNSAEDSGPGGRCNRESTIRSACSELASSDPPSGEHDDSEEESVDGNNYADEMASGETDGEEEEHGDSEEEHDESEEESGNYSEVGGYRPIEHLQCHVCRGKVRLGSSRCTACTVLNYACRDTGLCINPVTYDWLGCSFSTPGFTKAARGAAKEDVFRLPFVARRIQDGRLDPELAEEEWNNHVGDDHYADEETFIFYRFAITRHDNFQIDEEDFLDENPAARPAAAGPPAASPSAATGPPAAGPPAAGPPAASPPAASIPAASLTAAKAASPPAES